MFSKRQRTGGVRTEARLLALAPTAKGARQTGKRNVEHVLTLEVDGATVEHVCVVPHDKTPLLGDVLPVEVDGATLRVLFNETESLANRALASARAAQSGDAAGAAALLG